MLSDIIQIQNVRNTVRQNDLISSTHRGHGKEGKLLQIKSYALLTTTQNMSILNSDCKIQLQKNIFKQLKLGSLFDNINICSFYWAWQYDYVFLNPHLLDIILTWTIYFQQKWKVAHWRKDSFFNKWCWNNWTSHIKQEPQPFPHTRYKNLLEIDHRARDKTKLSNFLKKT